MYILVNKYLQVHEFSSIHYELFSYYYVMKCPIFSPKEDSVSPVWNENFHEAIMSVLLTSYVYFQYVLWCFFEQIGAYLQNSWNITEMY